MKQQGNNNMTYELWTLINRLTNNLTDNEQMCREVIYAYYTGNRLSDYDNNWHPEKVSEIDICLAEIRQYELDIKINKII